MRIAVDIDDVLGQQAKAWCTFTNQQLGTNFTTEDFQEDWVELWGVGMEKVIELHEAYHDSDLLKNIDPIPGALDSLQQLKQSGHTLFTLTSRSISLELTTTEWIDRHFPNVFESINFAGFFDDLSARDGEHTERLKKHKGGIAQNLHADILIDDQPKHAVGAVEHDIHAIVFGNYGWNRNEVPPTAHHAHHWQDVVKIISNYETS